MKFGPVAIAEAEGALLAHSVRAEGVALKKGDLVTAERRRQLAAAGVHTVVAARLDADDVGENDAALAIAARLAGAHVTLAEAFTGRVNLFAARAGLAVIDAGAIDRLNAVDEAITVATVPRFHPVAVGEMLATVKIIPFAARRATLDAALAAIGPAAPVALAPWRPTRVAVVSTLLPGLKASVVVKTLRVLEERLKPTEAHIVEHQTSPHDSAALADVLARSIVGADLVVVFGASALTDRRDVIPAAIEAIGGRIERFGMPVDPGNLLLLARLGSTPILGAPGCARSPKENGFDWILQRLIAGVPVSPGDIRALGVGGLLMEIASRPQPREPQPSEPLRRRSPRAPRAASAPTHDRDGRSG